MIRFGTVLFVALLLSCLACASKPDGYLLALKIVQNNISLFEVSLNGSITKLWNVSIDGYLTSGQVSLAGDFAFDEKTETVYLPTVKQITGINRNGKLVISKMLPTTEGGQYFWTYDYDKLTGNVVGVCSDAKQEMWSWCELNLKTAVLSQSPHRLPYTDGPNGLDDNVRLNSIDMKRKLIWYKPYLPPFIVAANFETGESVFKSGETGITCIAVDVAANKTYILNGNHGSQYSQLSVFELLPAPDVPRELVKLLPSSDIIISIFGGGCGIIEHTHEMYVLMTNITASLQTDNLMPTDLLLVDLDNLSYKQVSLDYKLWIDDHLLSGVKYVPAN